MRLAFIIAERKRGGQVLDQRLTNLGDNERRDHWLSRPAFDDESTTVKDSAAGRTSFIATPERGILLEKLRYPITAAGTDWVSAMIGANTWRKRPS